MSWQGKCSFVSVGLSKRYLAIDKTHFKTVKENSVKPIKIVKLSTEMPTDRGKIRVLSVGLDVALETQEEDTGSGELKGLAHLICCFLIHMSIMLPFAHDSLEKSLRIISFRSRSTRFFRASRTARHTVPTAQRYSKWIPTLFQNRSRRTPGPNSYFTVLCVPMQFIG